MSDLLTALDKVIEEAGRFRVTLTAKLDVPDGVKVSATLEPYRRAASAMEVALSRAGIQDDYIPLPLRVAKVDKPSSAAKVDPAPPSPPSPPSSTKVAKGFVAAMCDFPERFNRAACRAHCPKYRKEAGKCCPFVRDDPANCDDKRKRKCLGSEASEK